MTHKNRTPLFIGVAIAAAAVAIALFVIAPRFLPRSPATEPPALSEPDEEAVAPPLSQPATQPSTQSAQGFRDCPDVCPEMVRIPGQSFAIGRTEVTFAQWDACVAAGGCNGYRPDDRGWGRGDRPVIYVSWLDALNYVRWLSQSTGQRYRLPTDEEWEIAARGGTTTNYSWGDQAAVCDQRADNGANFWGCNDSTLPVGAFRPNAFGLYDMHGNVYEWVEDCFDAGCASRVLRGGGWASNLEGLGSATRDTVAPSYRYDGGGLRVARTL
jgi:formylglycine-generating enzyme required for sulfatase activity